MLFQYAYLDKLLRECEKEKQSPTHSSKVIPVLQEKIEKNDTQSDMTRLMAKYAQDEQGKYHI